jgi:prepilin-type N-terminal cleavage/methylation domain-containing protein
MTPRRRTKGFTLLELIVVTTIVAVVAATAAPAFLHSARHRVSRAARELASHLRLARTLAITTRRRTWVTFQTGNERYLVRIEDPDNPGRDNRIWVEHPITGASQFRVVLNSGEFDGVRIDSADFDGRNEAEFDRLGRPYDGDGGLLDDDGTVTLSGGGRTQTVRVSAQTGFIQVE